jgi:hypothetical protein
MSKNPKIITIIISVGVIFSIFPVFVSAASLREKVNFFIDSSYDLTGRSQLTATCQKITSQLYFYIDDSWWNSLDYNQQNKISSALDFLSSEFSSKIYPTLTANFGSPNEPGIDRDAGITVLIHPMIEEAGGYVNSGDGYPKLQSPKSNEREMFYLNSKYIEEPQAKSFLAHEFMHLITFNQKEILRKMSEEVWLNEAYSEYAPTLLGYDNIYEGSNLQRRVKNFLERPNDSLTEWQNKSYDYGVVNLFTQYLVERYGFKILIDSLHSSKVGIPSINEALMKNGFNEDFAQVFTNWTIVVLMNDCSLGGKYCYLNPNLKGLRIVPLLTFLPLVGDSVLSITHRATNWAGNWQRIVGGRGNLTLEFDGADDVQFKVPYLVCDLQGKCTIEFLSLDKEQKGAINLLEFDKNYNSLTIIPSIQNKTSGFNGLEPFYLFSWKATISEKTAAEREEELIVQLLAQIEYLQKEIAKVRAQIVAIQGSVTPTTIPAGFSFEKNLSEGMNDSDIVYLKIILAKEGLVDGLKNTEYFGPQTKTAVILFQERYKADISAAAGYTISASGFVGTGTRVKLNEILLR